MRCPLIGRRQVIPVAFVTHHVRCARPHWVTCVCCTSCTYKLTLTVRPRPLLPSIADSGVVAQRPLFPVVQHVLVYRCALPLRPTHLRAQRTDDSVATDTLPLREGYRLTRDRALQRTISSLGWGLGSSFLTVVGRTANDGHERSNQAL